MRLRELFTDGRYTKIVGVHFGFKVVKYTLHGPPQSFSLLPFVFQLDGAVFQEIRDFSAYVMGFDQQLSAL